MDFIVSMSDKHIEGLDPEMVINHRRIAIMNALNDGGVPFTQVMYDDRPEPMDFVEYIDAEGHPDGSTCTEVTFTNGVSICSCYLPQTDAHRLAPNLRT